jgi:hypothetical protein
LLWFEAKRLKRNEAKRYKIPSKKSEITMRFVLLQFEAKNLKRNEAKEAKEAKYFDFF